MQNAQLQAALWGDPSATDILAIYLTLIAAGPYLTLAGRRMLYRPVHSSASTPMVALIFNVLSKPAPERRRIHAT